MPPIVCWIMVLGSFMCILWMLLIYFVFREGPCLPTSNGVEVDVEYEKSLSKDEQLSRHCKRRGIEHPLLPPWKVQYPDYWKGMNVSDRLNWLEQNVTKEWCVFEDLAPFWLLIHSQHDTEEGAVSGAARMSGLRVKETKMVHRLNRKMCEDEDFFNLLLTRECYGGRKNA